MLAIKETNTKQIDTIVEQQMHANNDIMKPHLYQNGKVTPVILDCTIHDVIEYWNEDARLREGFETNYDEKMITVPNFFIKINGEFESLKDRKKLNKVLKKNSLCYNSLSFTDKHFNGRKKEIKKFNKLMKEKLDISVSLLTETLSNDNLINSIASTLNVYQANYILDRLNYFIKYYYKDKKEDDLLLFLNNVIFMNKKIAKLLQGWDYPYAVPKIVFFDKYNDSSADTLDYMMIHFLNFLGIDIAVVSPSGRGSIETYNNRLKDTMVSITLDKIREPRINHKKTLTYITITVAAIGLLTGLSFGIFSSESKIKEEQEIEIIKEDNENNELSDSLNNNSIQENESSESLSKISQSIPKVFSGITTIGVSIGIIMSIIGFVSKILNPENESSHELIVLGLLLSIIITIMHPLINIMLEMLDSI